MRGAREGRREIIILVFTSYLCLLISTQRPRTFWTRKELKKSGIGAVSGCLSKPREAVEKVKVKDVK